MCETSTVDVLKRGGEISQTSAGSLPLGRHFSRLQAEPPPIKPLSRFPACASFRLCFPRHWVTVACTGSAQLLVALSSLEPQRQQLQLTRGDKLSAEMGVSCLHVAFSRNCDRRLYGRIRVVCLCHERCRRKQISNSSIKQHIVVRSRSPP